MNKGGTNGKVTALATNASGTDVTVHFPGDPTGTPPVPAYDETYVNVLDPWLRRFENATGTVDVSVNTELEDRPVTNVVEHRT